MSRLFLKAANSIVNLFVVLLLCVAGVYAAYALWDNSQIYSSAFNVQADMLKLKPTVSEGDDTASFEELLAINPDVCAWVTLDGTKIDYPVLQGSTNLTYINKDVYGNFSLSGSIYLDTRNSRDFSDRYSLLYGHHMEKSAMFGDLELYEDETFFEQNSTGKLILPDKSYNLEIFACMLVKSGDENIFNTDKRQTDIDGLFSYVRQNSLYVREETIKKAEQSDDTKVLAFSTCSSEFTDARTVILTVMKPNEQ